MSKHIINFIDNYKCHIQKFTAEEQINQYLAMKTQTLKHIEIRNNKVSILDIF